MTSRKRASDTTIIESKSRSFESMERERDHMTGNSRVNHNISTMFTATAQMKPKMNNPMSTTSISVARPKLRVKIKKWHGVAQWTWDCGEDEVCGICHSAFEDVAPDAKYPGDECPVAVGKCVHKFHLQCITRSLATKNTCPICRREWEFASESDNNANATS